MSGCLATSCKKYTLNFLSVSVTKCGRNYTERYNGPVRCGPRPVWFPGHRLGHVRCIARRQASLVAILEATDESTIFSDGSRGSVFRHTGFGRRVCRPLSKLANVKTMYNAKGDGITDDTAALQAALNAEGIAGKSDVVYLPAGAYKSRPP